jgi:hypothetical protein
MVWFLLLFVGVVPVVGALCDYLRSSPARRKAIRDFIAGRGGLPGDRE